MPVRKIRSISDFARTFSDFGKSSLWVTISPSGDRPSILLVLVGDGQLDSALGSSSLEDETSALGTHAGAETKLPVPLGSAGLIGALHGYVLLVLWATAPDANESWILGEMCRSISGIAHNGKGVGRCVSIEYTRRFGQLEFG